jgi:putative DNA methylase
MSRSGAWCPVCSGSGTVAMILDDIRAEGMARRLGVQMTAVVVDGRDGKEYRLPTEEELQAVWKAADQVEGVFKEVPFGLPTEPVPQGASRQGGGSPFTVYLYGFDQWYKLFTPRQLVALGTFVKHTSAARDAMRAEGYPPEWVEAVQGYLAMAVDRLADRSSTLCRPDPPPTQSGVINTFSRFALPITWDFIEGVTTETASGGFPTALEWVAKVAEQAQHFRHRPRPQILYSSATVQVPEAFDVIVTDPPYYDAIPYSDLMDFFYIWLRRTLQGFTTEIDEAFREPLGPKWSHEDNDGELIDDASRFGGDNQKSKAAYEEGMFRAFQACHKALGPDGRMVIVFANKQPDAWETLVSSMIRAGFVVDESWPIQTEMGNRTRALTSAALASSVWLVCRKRPEWDTQVLEEMCQNIYEKLRQFWDAGIRGPDFVWAATGPALEPYSKHPAVKKADEPNSLMTVSEFLRHMRRIVVDYVVGRILTQDGSGDASALDDVTLYYLLHRHDFGLSEAPVGASILYAQSCNLRDRDLVDRHDLLAYGKGKAAAEEADDAAAKGDEEDHEEEAEATSGSVVKLKRWDQRKGNNLSLNSGGLPAPLVDQVHRIMRLWRAGDVQKVDAYIEDQSLRRNPVFPRLLQALIELAGKDNQPDERVLLESVMNHIGARGMLPHGTPQQIDLLERDPEER